MREIRQSGSEGGDGASRSLPLFIYAILACFFSKFAQVGADLTNRRANAAPLAWDVRPKKQQEPRQPDSRHSS